jgi:hypothetical protein
MCVVASAPAAFRVRVWEIMSRGQGLGARRTPPESASVGYSPADMTEDVVRQIALPTGLVDNKVCASDDVWSGLRMVIRRELCR